MHEISEFLLMNCDVSKSDITIPMWACEGFAFDKVGTEQRDRARAFDLKWTVIRHASKLGIQVGQQNWGIEIQTVEDLDLWPIREFKGPERTLVWG